MARCCDPVKSLHCRLLSCLHPQSLSSMVEPMHPSTGKSTCDAVIRVLLPLNASVMRAYCYTLIGHTFLFLCLFFFFLQALSLKLRDCSAIFPGLSFCTLVSEASCVRVRLFLCLRRKKNVQCAGMSFIVKQLYQKINAAF